MDIVRGSDAQPSSRVAKPRIRRLAIVVGLPLVDGVFVTMVLAGVLNTPSGILVTGLVIFGGTAAAAVVLADCAGNPGRRLLAVGVLGAIIVPTAALQAMLAPTLATWIDVTLLQRFAAIILAILAIDMIGLRLRRYLPSAGPLVVLAVLVSLDPKNGMVLPTDTTLLLNGAIAATIGIIAVAVWILVGHWLGSLFDPRRIRIAGGLSLGVLAVALMTTIPTAVALAALGVGLVLSVDMNEFDGSAVEPQVG